MSSRRLIGLSTLVLPAVCAGPAHARIELTVTRVGFPTLSGPVVRNGAWAPVVVDVSLLDNHGSFDGTIRVGQLDGDGDECFDGLEVHLRRAAGGNQTYTLYVPAKPVRGQCTFYVSAFDANGEAVEVIAMGETAYRAAPAQQPSVVPDDDLILLDIGSASLGPVKDLADDDKRLAYSRFIHLGNVGPGGVPEHWFGLEAVDHIIWDDARPEDLTPRQLEALLEWVRQGGTLLVAASRTAGSVLLTKPLAAALPMDIGDLITVGNLRSVRTKLAEAPFRTDDEPEGDWLGTPFPVPVPVAQCRLREGAKVVASEDVLIDGEPVNIPVVARHRFGHGHIIYSAVTIKDLFSAPGRATEFFEDLFYILKIDNADEGRPNAAGLFGNVIRPISFSTSGGLYLFLAGVSTVAYVLLATFGTWGIVSNRGWRRHSWSAFAVVAIGTSVVAAVVVRSRQGFGESVRQVSIVDLAADSAEATATALFGVKTSSDKRLDFWLPEDPLGTGEPGQTTAFLRPISGAPDPMETATGFADPEDYRLAPASAVIEDVRIRATLKQFEGRWRGTVSGRVSGGVAVDRGVVTNDSYVINDLGVDLRNCWLMISQKNPEELGIVRAFGAILAYDIGDLPSDGKKVSLYDRCFPSGRGGSVGRIRSESALAQRQKEWARPFLSVLSSFPVPTTGGSSQANTSARPAESLDLDQKALLLLTMVGDLEITDRSFAGAWGRSAWSRDRARSLDLRPALQRDSVYLLGFADDPGPLRLFRRSGNGRYRPIEPDATYSKTMYRVRIPATVQGEFDPDAEDERDDLDKLLESKGS